MKQGSGMQRLTINLSDRRSWYDFYTADEEGAVVFCPTITPPHAGSPVMLDISFNGGPRLFMQGVVVWQRSRPSSDSRMKPGAGVRLNDADRAKAQFMSGFARGGLLDQRQGGRRLPVRLQTTYSTKGGRRRMNFTRDVSESGICLNCAEAIDPKSPLSLEIVFPRKIGAYKIQGWVVRNIRDEKGSAVAVNLVFSSQDDRFGFAGALRRLESLLMSGELAEQHLY